VATGLVFIGVLGGLLDLTEGVDDLWWLVEENGEGEEGGFAGAVNGSCAANTLQKLWSCGTAFGGWQLMVFQ
ncbi:hypothetical protein HAX54_033850, partial [Datura stramonium]|nr:hypothetical protein [Datura stramonium]